MPTDGEGRTSQDAAIAREILDAAQQQQRNWDQAAIANQQSSNEEMVCAKTKLRNMCAPHLAAQSLRAEGERRANEATTPTQAGEQKFKIEYRQAREIVWAFIPSLGDDACGVSAENPTCSCSVYDFYKNERMVDRPVESADESRLVDCIHFQNEMIPPGYAASLANAIRERDEARAELAKLEAAHKDLKIDRDQACFERDELVKVCEGIVAEWDNPQGELLIPIRNARAILAHIKKQGGAS